MIQLPLFQPTFWTVTELTDYLRNLLESDPKIQDLWVRGEVSNLSRPTSGHLYFTLKDAASSLRCVVWRNVVIRQNFIPQEGQGIEIHGGISIYEAAGQYQLYADLIRPAGEGALYQEFLRLKAALEAEGLFNPERKRPIPRWPQRIGIVTSPTGAALRDMLNTLRRRYPLVEVILAPTAVQGSAAASGIVTAIQALNQIAKPDVIIIARGGGSIEDLWAFNDEQVAHAIFNSPSPIISGVGHETDFTIADFVADLRAPTPTAAAELATPNRIDLQEMLSNLERRSRQAFHQGISQRRWGLANLQNRLLFRSPQARIRTNRQQLDEFSHLLDISINHNLRLHRIQLEGFKQKMTSLNPLAVFQRGYAAVTKPDGVMVRSVHQVKAGELLKVRVVDGQFPVEVQETDWKINSEHG